MPTNTTSSKGLNIWRKVVANPNGSRSLKLLKQSGFDLRSGTWPARIVAIPFLPNRRARTRALRSPRSARLVIRFLRELARAVETPYCHLEAYDTRKRVLYIGPSVESGMHPKRLLETADFLDMMCSRKWAVAEHNPQQNEIAGLRWEIKFRTRQAHDNELVDLLDAVYQASGYKDGFPMDYDTLKKVIRNEKNTRMALRRKVRRLH